ncbi:MAG: hypothetical protein HOP31_08800 [Ignavibacteria bacterium]|nr:hypothetical protein [Ignavibacteria bacterium]
MKKIIILILSIISLEAFGQTLDTVNFSLVKSKSGFYEELVNRTVYNGVAAGSLRIPLTYDYTSIDTSLWQITVGENGFYSYAVNRNVFYGKDTATVRLLISYDVSADTVYYSPNLSGYAYKDSSNTFTGITVLRQAAVDTINSISGTLLIQADSADAIKIQQTAMYLGDGTGLVMGYNNNGTIGNGYSWQDDENTHITAPNSGQIVFTSDGTQRLRINSDVVGEEINLIEGSYLTALRGDGGIKTDNIWINSASYVNTPSASLGVSSYIGTTEATYLSIPNKWFLIKDENGTEYLVPGYTP